MTGIAPGLRCQDPRLLGGELFVRQQALGFHLAKFPDLGHAVVRRRRGRGCGLCCRLLRLDLGSRRGRCLRRRLVDHRLLLGSRLLLLVRGRLLLIGSTLD